MMVAWFVRIGPTVEDEPEVARYWSGEGQVTTDVGEGTQTYTGTSYQGTALVGINAIKTSITVPNRRATISIVLPDDASFQAALVDPGPVPINVYWAFSTDNGTTFTQINRRFVGRLSNPVVTQGTYKIDIETWVGADRYGESRDVSFEGHQLEYPGDDSFFQLPILGAQGVQTKWPN